jgi:hypothetical protein
MQSSLVPRVVTLLTLAGVPLCAQAPIKAEMPIIMPGPSRKAFLRFEITVPAAVRAQPITGRAAARDGAVRPAQEARRHDDPLVDLLEPGAPQRRSIAS